MHSQEPGTGQRPKEGLYCSFGLHLSLPKENLKACKYFINISISDISNAKQDCVNKSAGYSCISSLHFFHRQFTIFSITLKPLLSIIEPAPVSQLPRGTYTCTCSVLRLFLTLSTAEPSRLMSLSIVHSCIVIPSTLLKRRRSSKC